MLYNFDEIIDRRESNSLKWNVAGRTAEVESSI